MPNANGTTASVVILYQRLILMHIHAKGRLIMILDDESMSFGFLSFDLISG